MDKRVCPLQKIGKAFQIKKNIFLVPFFLGRERMIAFNHISKQIQRVIHVSNPVSNRMTAVRQPERGILPFLVPISHDTARQKRKQAPKIWGLLQISDRKNYLLENWGARRAAFKPYFLRSFILGSRVRKPAFFKVARRFSLSY